MSEYYEYLQLLGAALAGWVFSSLRIRWATRSLFRDLPTLLRDRDKWERIAKEYLGKIEEVISERETWRALYNDQAGGHDNAQALMLNTITSILHAHKKATGKDLQVDPIINLARGEWVSSHGESVRKERGDDGLRVVDPKQAS